MGNVRIMAEDVKVPYNRLIRGIQEVKSIGRHSHRLEETKNYFREIGREIMQHMIQPNGVEMGI